MLATATAQNGHTRHHLTRRTHRARGSRQQPSNLRVVALAAALVVITGWSGAQGAERAAELDSLDRRWIQEELATKGFDPGPADGQFGPKTRRAIKAWQEAKGQAATGELTKEQSETLLYRDRRTVRTWPNGDRYEGDFDGKRTGRGVLIWGTGPWEGDRYKGDFVNGQRTGHGVYTWTDGRRYEGDFLDGKRTGRGILTWGRGPWEGDRYKGAFVNGQRTGHGVYTWADGRRYEGDFLDSKRTGRGVYTWPNGNRYEGSFVDGKLHGHGIWTSPDGSRYMVENRNGEQVSSEGLTASAGKATELQRNTAARTHDTTPKPRDREQAREYWGAYIEVGGYTTGPQGYGVTWNYRDPQSAMEAALRQCTKAASYEECGGNDLTRGYGLTYWLFSTSPMPPSVSRFPDRSDDGLSDEYFRIDVDDWVFAVYHVDKRCIAIFGDGPEGTDASWDLRRKFGNTADEARQDINSGFPVKAVKCNKR